MTTTMPLLLLHTDLPLRAKSQHQRRIYLQLNNLISEHKNNKHLLLVINNFNIKTGSAYPIFSESMGKFGKGISNSNGEHLLEYAMQNDLMLTNTLFPQRMAHRTTWTSHERFDHLSSDGTSRRNPCRYQIDYITRKNMHKIHLQKSRSYGGAYIDDPSKYYQAMRKVNSTKLKKPLKTYDDSFSLIKSEEDQISETTEFFDDLFLYDEAQMSLTPEKIEPPFTPEEIQKASQKLKNNKATWPNGFHAKHLKYGLNQLFVNTSNILNNTSKTGEYPDVHLGTLNPLAKPPKRNEKVNVKTIILLSPLWRMMTISLIDRCWNRMKKHIPLSQAAYQSGRSTTEQVYTINITSENYDIFLLLLDMPKAFDTVDRRKLMNIFGSILTKCELPMMHVLINNVILNVKIGNKTGPGIHTNIEICQGDCLSDLLFILYLAFAVKPL